MKTLKGGGWMWLFLNSVTAFRLLQICLPPPPPLPPTPLDIGISTESESVGFSVAIVLLQVSLICPQRPSLGKLQTKANQVKATREVRGCRSQLLYWLNSPRGWASERYGTNSCPTRWLTRRQRMPMFFFFFYFIFNLVVLK